MIATGPAQVTFVPVATNVQVVTISFDLVAHTFSFQYTDPSGRGLKTVTGPIPAGVQTAIENHVLRSLETSEAWAANSASVVTP